MSDNELRELMEGIRGSLRELLDALELDSRLRGAERRVHVLELSDERAERQVWLRTPRERRETLLLHALGDERLTRGEIAERINQELRATDRSAAVYVDDIRPLALRMVREGQLDRISELFQGKPRYRYSHKRRLEGPIVELERAYHDDEAGA
jgi:hypothetical protein